MASTGGAVGVRSGGVPTRTVRSTRAHRLGLMAAILLLSWVALALAQGDGLTPPVWPASGLAVGLLLTQSAQHRTRGLAVVFALLVVALLLHGTAPLVATAYALSCAAEAFVVCSLLSPRTAGKRAALLDDGDVSRMVGAISAGAAVSSAGHGLTMVLHGGDSPLLGMVAVFGTHAASLMVLLPLFVETPAFPPLAARNERVTQWVLALGTTAIVFASNAAPPAVFVVMPMFAWLGFRGTLREASLLLTSVGALATAMTALGRGPIQGLAARYDLAPELSIGFMQLFLLDCGLILLPLSVAVTQQRMAASRAAAGRETLERLVASATGTAIVATDQEGRITLFNPGAVAMFGHPVDEVLGRTPDLFLPTGELARQAGDAGADPTFIAICRSVVGSAEPRRLWRFVRRDGEERVMSMTLSEVPDENGAVAGYLCTAEDVTEREKTQAALLLALEHQDSAVRQLRELSRIKSDFVATVSHELRTPITSIVGYTELLEDGVVGELSAGQRDMIGRVDQNSRRLLLLIEDLLTLSHIESATLRIQPEPFDLRDAVSGARDAVAEMLTRRDLEVVVTVPTAAVAYRGDPARLERMLLNLMTNAVKFTPDGGCVAVTLSIGEEAAEIEVRDNGLGIPVEEQDQLFTRFFRSSTATERAIQGTGLGLSIVQAVVALHGGSVGLTSAPGEGTVVTVSLPWLGVPEVGAEVAPADACPATTAEAPVNPAEPRPA